MDECVLCRRTFEGVPGLKHPVCALCSKGLQDGYEAYKREQGWFKWTVEIEVHKVWVEDGFNLTDDRINGIMGRALPHANGNEFKCKVLDAPDAKRIRIAQGYEKETA